MIHLKDLNKSRLFRVWYKISVPIVSFLLIISLIVTQNVFLKGTIDAVLGGKRAVISGDNTSAAYYVSDYESKKDTLQAARELTREIEAEGTVLLKNEAALPIKTPVSDSTVSKCPRISVFGKNSVNLVYGGSGSSGSNTNGATDLYTGLENAGYSVNPTLKAFYENDSLSGGGRPSSTPDMGTILTGYPVGETPISSYTADVRSSYQDYADAAIVVISRIGGEGYDLPRTMKVSSSGDYKAGFSDKNAWDSDTPVEGARSAEDHYLQLDQNETDLLEEVCTHFETVIVLLNCTSIEAGFLDDSSHYAWQENIKAALWIGNPGYTGIDGACAVLNGSVSPSGHLADTWARDFKADPTWNNFSSNLSYMGNRYLLNGKMTTKASYFTVDYEEGIYVGYRYWETRGETDGENWYREHVVYPLGYGMSYTSFSWTLENVAEWNGAAIDADSTISFQVTVRNEGDIAGKDVVQLYVTAPYYDGGIEKASRVLAGFAKTETLQPGQSETVTISVDAQSLASYDCYDANSNGITGWELEHGEYQFSFLSNAHGMDDGSHVGESITISMSVEDDLYFATDSTTGTQIENLFEDADDQLGSVLSRADWEGTWPSMPTEEERNMDSNFIHSLTWTVDDDGKSWYTDVMPETGKNASIQLHEMIGKDFDDPDWDTVLNALTTEDMVNLVGIANYNTAAISSIGKPRTTDPDGPSGFTLFMGDPSVYDTCFYCSECVLAATWNEQLAYEMGCMIGNEGIWGDSEGRASSMPYSGWYAPATNIHRSQFGGRNWEYYSEDGFLSGKMAANVCAGAKSKGVYTYLKHFALNDQETNRDSNGILTWATEQSMREIYFRPFEIAVKEGRTNAIMSSFNRIGGTWAGGNYNLLTKLLREEWGFVGMVVTDYNMMSSYMSADQMIRAGGNLNLSQDGRPTAELTATQVNALRNASKDVLYVVANSCAMNGISESTSITYAMPYWEIALITLDCIVVLGSAIWCAWVISKVKRLTALQNS